MVVVPITAIKIIERFHDKLPELNHGTVMGPIDTECLSTRENLTDMMMEDHCKGDPNLTDPQKELLRVMSLHDCDPYGQQWFDIKDFCHNLDLLFKLCNFTEFQKNSATVVTKLKQAIDKGNITEIRKIFSSDYGFNLHIKNYNQPSTEPLVFPSKLEGNKLIDLKKLNFENQIFENCNFNDTQFQGARFENCFFKDCSFKNCNFQNAKFANSSFWKSELSGCNFDRAIIENDMCFNNCRLDACKFTELISRESSIAFEKASKLKDVSFANADLDSLWIRVPSLSKLCLQKAKIKELTIESAELSGQMNLEGSKIHDATIDKSCTWTGDFCINLKGTDLKNLSDLKYFFDQQQSSGQPVLQGLDSAENLKVLLEGLKYPDNDDEFEVYVDGFFDHAAFFNNLFQLHEKTLRNQFSPDQFKVGDLSEECLLEEAQQLGAIGSLEEGLTRQDIKAISLLYHLDTLIPPIMPFHVSRPHHLTHLRTALLQRSLSNKTTINHEHDKLKKLNINAFRNFKDSIRKLSYKLLVPELAKLDPQQSSKIRGLSTNYDHSMWSFIDRLQDELLVHILIKPYGQENAGALREDLKGLSSLLDWSQDLHNHQIGFSRMLNFFSDSSQWQPFLKEKEAEISEGIKVVNWTNKDELETLSATTGICIGDEPDYANKAAAGDHHYFSFMKNGHPLSTLELQLFANNEIPAGKTAIPIKQNCHDTDYSFVELQHESDNNANPSNEAKTAAQKFYKKLNEGSLEIQLEGLGAIAEENSQTPQANFLEKTIGIREIVDFNDKDVPKKDNETCFDYVQRFAFDILSGVDFIDLGFGSAFDKAMAGEKLSDEDIGMLEQRITQLKSRMSRADFVRLTKYWGQPRYKALPIIASESRQRGKKSFVIPSYFRTIDDLMESKLSEDAPSLREKIRQIAEEELFAK